MIAYGYIITFAGVLLGAVHRNLQARRARGQQRVGAISMSFRDVFHSIDFWMSGCASPIVYALLWKSLTGGGVAALTIVGLQNGFCCTVILRARAGRCRFGRNGPPAAGGVFRGSASCGAPWRTCDRDLRAVGEPFALFGERLVVAFDADAAAARVLTGAMPPSAAGPPF